MDQWYISKLQFVTLYWGIWYSFFGEWIPRSSLNAYLETWNYHQVECHLVMWFCSTSWLSCANGAIHLDLKSRSVLRKMAASVRCAMLKKGFHVCSCASRQACVVSTLWSMYVYIYIAKHFMALSTKKAYMHIYIYISFSISITPRTKIHG